MGYAERVLQPGETIAYRGRLHWVIYLSGLLISLFSLALLGGSLAPRAPNVRNALLIIALIGLAFGLAKICQAWFQSTTTEIIVTNRRVIYKTGFISRSSIEMNLDKIESVLVQQGILGRMLDYGALIIRGVGSGIEPVANLAEPLKFHQYVNASAG
jgi:hypothetical protein